MATRKQRKEQLIRRKQVQAEHRPACLPPPIKRRRPVVTTPQLTNEPKPVLAEPEPRPVQITTEPAAIPAPPAEVSLDEARLYQMPDHDEIMRRLNTVATDPHAREGFYEEVAKWGANQQLYPEGIVNCLVLNLAMYEQQVGPMVTSIISMMMPFFIEALVPDNDEIRQAALDTWEMITGKMKEMAVEQAKVDQNLLSLHLGHHQPLTDEVGLRTYEQILTVCALYDSFFANGTTEETAKRRNSDPNPFYNQTASGLFLEMYYGQPSDLWTPWGKWDFANVNDHIDVEAFLSLLDYEVFMEEKTSEMGVHGPVYAIHGILPNKGIAEIRFDEPITLINPQEEMGYEESRASWAKVTNAWHEKHSSTRPLTGLELSDLDHKIRRDRALTEPPIPQPGDITCLDDLLAHAGKIIKYTYAQNVEGFGWTYAKLGSEQMYDDHQGGGVRGMSSNTEVLPNAQVHSSIGLTADRFTESGLVVRLTTEEETEGKVFSYDFSVPKTPPDQPQGKFLCLKEGREVEGGELCRPSYSFDRKWTCPCGGTVRKLEVIPA